MSYPQHPESIILKNKFYPSGVNQERIWNYYQQNKHNIINQLKHRDVMLAILTDINKPIIKRKLNNRFIKLTHNNFDNIMTGRTIAIYSTMGYYDHKAIVDIDADTFEQSKVPTVEIYNILNSASFIRNVSIRYTGKIGFHIICEFIRKMKINDIRMILERYLLSKIEIMKKYTVTPKRTRGIPNIDLWASNKNKGAFITLHSLSIIGLKCMDVSPLKVKSFTQEQAKI